MTIPFWNLLLTSDPTVNFPDGQRKLPIFVSFSKERSTPHE